jgi:hypothetical protein
LAPTSTGCSGTRTQGIVITLAAIGLLLLAGMLALFRRRITTSGSMLALALGAGLLIGQTFGPSREPLEISTGQMMLRLDAPIQAVATGPADCQTVASGAELQVTQDVNARLPLEGVELARYPLVSTSFSSGDRWAPEIGRRTDELSLTIYLSSSFEVVDGGPTEAWLRSDPSSHLVAELNGDDGSVTFSGLVPDGEPQTILGASGAVSGSVDWTCGTASSATPTASASALPSPTASPSPTESAGPDQPAITGITLDDVLGRAGDYDLDCDREAPVAAPHPPPDLHNALCIGDSADGNVSISLRVAYWADDSVLSVEAITLPLGDSGEVAPSWRDEWLRWLAGFEYSGSDPGVVAPWLPGQHRR